LPDPHGSDGDFCQAPALEAAVIGEIGNYLLNVISGGKTVIMWGRA